MKIYSTAIIEMRNLTDFQITCNNPFFLVILLSIYKKFYELTLLIGKVLLISFLYHIGREKQNVFFILTILQRFV